MRTILSYPLSPVSAALASSDKQSIAKTTKSTLLTLLEEKCKSVAIETTESHNTALILDAMAIVQSLSRSAIPATFGELAKRLLDNVLRLATKVSARRVDFAGDQYLTVSIKNVERARRVAGGSSVRTIYSPSQQTPKQWTKYLADGSNKAMLQAFIVKHRQSLAIDADIEIYTAVDRECKRLRFSQSSTPTVDDVLELKSDHEEADTMMILRAFHANANQFDKIVLCSPDTDVAVLLLY